MLLPPSPLAGQPRKVYGLNSADAVFKETRDKFYIAARRWLNETLRQGRGWCVSVCVCVCIL